MRVIDRIDIMNRRGFMGHSLGTAALLAAAPVLPASALAATGLRSGPMSDLPTLVQMAQDLYPHDHLPASAYELAVATIDSQFADAPGGTLSMGQGATELDAAARALKGAPYAALPGEGDRVAVLKVLEQAGSAFFKAMRSGMITALYNQEEVWPTFGYEGSSVEQGGYLHRGFDDLDWLPA